MPLNVKLSNVNNNNNKDFEFDDRDDPEKLFADLTEIGHGNFGAVYYVSLLE